MMNDQQKSEENDGKKQGNPETEFDDLEIELNLILQSTGINIWQLFNNQQRQRLLDARKHNEIRPNDARRSLLNDLLPYMKSIDMKQALISAYVHGLCGEKEDANRDGIEVFQIFNADAAFLKKLHFLTKEEIREAVYELTILFLRGQYPIVTGKDEKAARQVLEQELDTIRKTPFALPEQEEARSAAAIEKIAPQLADQAAPAYLRVIHVLAAMQKFRKAVSQS